MKIFISWSGDRSRAVGEVINDWLRCVIQAVQPWMSTRDIDRGALWLVEINEQLNDTSIGIICLTQENKNRPWILFEAGALAKGRSTSRVCPLLIDLEVSDVDDPLAQFNLTFPNRKSMWSLVHTINGCLGATRLDVRVLEQVFDTYWKQFEEKFKAAVEANQPQDAAVPRSEKEILNQILAAVRGVRTQVGGLSPSPSSYKEKRLRELRDLEKKRPKRSEPPIELQIRELQATNLTEDEIYQELVARGYESNYVIENVLKVDEENRAAALLDAL